MLPTSTVPIKMNVLLQGSQTGYECHVYITVPPYKVPATRMSPTLLRCDNYLVSVLKQYKCIPVSHLTTRHCPDVTAIWWAFWQVWVSFVCQCPSLLSNTAEMWQNMVCALAGYECHFYVSDPPYKVSAHCWDITACGSCSGFILCLGSFL